MTERVVLAYSGGLDTSVAIGWIGEETGAEVVAVAVDVGQGGEDLEEIRKRALACGAVEAVVVDARAEFAETYCLAALHANGLYMSKYPLVSALSRPLIVTHLARVAAEPGGGIVAHGCTGKGNDQVRFEVGFASLAPDLEVLAPVRDYAWTREKAIAFAEENAIPINVSKRSPFSIDQNVWGRAVETGFLEHLWNAPTKDVYDYTEDPTVNWNSPDEVIVGFERGVPVSIDGRLAIPKGAHASGVVKDAKPAGRFKGGAVLSLTLTNISVKNETYEIATSAPTETSTGKGKRTAALAGGGAGGGALIGGLAGGGKGALIGGLIGAAAGTGGAGFTGNRDITINAETLLNFKLVQSLEIKNR